MSQDYFGLTIPFLDVLGVEPEFAKDGHSRIRLNLRPELLNSFHVAHGGVVMTILDFAMAAAARSSHEHILGVITIDMTTSFLRPSKEGEKGDIERDKFVIWDCLVYAGEYLIGKTFEERIAMVDVRYPCKQLVTDKGLEIYDYLCATFIEGVYKSPVYSAGFDFLYNDLVKTPLYEGLVLKKKDAKLTYGFQEKNNSEWQVKCRKANKLYNF